MCDNDFITPSIIMMILARYDIYHDSMTKTTEPLLLIKYTQISQIVNSRICIIKLKIL